MGLLGLMSFRHRLVYKPKKKKREKNDVVRKRTQAREDKSTYIPTRFQSREVLLIP